MLPTTGSTITAAIWSPCARNACSTASTELNGRAMVVSAKRFGHALRVGDPERRHAGAGLHQQRIHVAVIAAFELDGEVAAGEAARHADARDMVASVPELTSRTISIDGTASQIASASSISCSVGAPKLVPISSACSQRREDLRMAVAQQQRTPGARHNRCTRCRRRRRGASPRRAR